MATPCKKFCLIVPNEPETTEVNPGSDVTVPCHLSPEMSAADMEIRWFKGTDCVCLYMEGQMIAGVGYKTRVGLNKEMERGNISLELKDVRESDDGVYLCQVTSEDRTKEKTVTLSLKNHEDTEMLQTEETTPEQTVLKKKMEKSALMAVFSEWKDTSKCLEKAKQESKEKEAEIEELKAKLLQTFGKPEKENTQLEKMQETSKLKLDNPETKNTPVEKQQLNIEEVKVFTLYTGNKKALHAVHKNFIGTLRNQILNLREVGTLDESDIVLIFCPVVSRTGTDIDGALKIFKGNTGSKLVVLVVLHHTIDPGKIVPDSSIYVSRTDILTVDYLFNEDTGLLMCQKNSDTDVKVVNWLIQQGSKAVCTFIPLQKQGQGKPHKSKKDKSESESVQTKRPKREDDKPKTKVVKVFSILTGKTNNCDKEFIDILGKRIENLREVHTVNESDIILVFCPIVSRAGTDIDAALKLTGCTDSENSQKLTILVVLHHTFDPEKTVPDSSRCVNRTDILTVDCLFYEDTGLLTCQKNSQSTDKVVNWLIQQGEKTGVNICPCGNKKIGSIKFPWSQVKKQEVSGDNVQQTSSAASCPVKYFVNVTGDAQEHHVHFIKALQKKMNLREVPTVQESDVILLFCPDISGCHKRTDRPVVLISLHQTLDPDNPKRRAVCSVDYIFCEGKGLTECQLNNVEISAVSRWLKDKKQRASRNTHQSSPVHPVSTSSHPVSYFTNLTGDAKKHLFHFIETTKNQIRLNEVFSVEDSDVILLFCPDISDYNKRTDKPVVLISLHNTLQSDSVPSSNEFVNRRDILPLDCIFIEGKGLPNCIINQAEYSAFSQFLITKIIKDK